MSTIKSLVYTINNRGRNQNLLAIVILAMLLGLIYRDVIFYGRTFLMETAAYGTMGFSGPYKYKGEQPGFVANDPAAMALFSEPMNRFFSNSIKKGDFPLWNPYAGLAGAPFLADGQTGPLEPIQFLFSLGPRRYWPFLVDWQLLLRFFIAGYASYLFARRQGLDFIAGIATGALFMVSSYFITSGNHPQVKTESLLPLVIYGFDQLVDTTSDDRKWPWLCALIVGWAIIAAMPEATFFVLFLGSLWYFYKAMIIRKENIRTVSEVKSVLIRYLVPTILGLLISAAYLLPFLEFLLLSNNAHTPGAPVNFGGGAMAILNLLGLVFPLKDLYFLHLGFWSIFSLMLVLVNIKEWSEFRLIIFFFGSYAIVFTLAIFDFPLTNWLHNVPVFDRIAFYKYPIPSIMFSLAMLTGILVTKVKNVSLSHKKISMALLIIPIAFLVISISNGLKNLYVLNLPEAEMQREILGIIAVTIVTTYIFRYIFKKHFWQAALVVLMIAEPFYWSTRIKRPNRYDPYFQQIPGFINYLRDDKGSYRIFGLDGLLYTDISTAYGISDIRWLYALVPQRTYDFTVRFLNSEGPKLIRFTGTDFPISDRMFGLLNVKYVLSKNLGLCDRNEETVQPEFIKQELNVEQLIINRSPKAVIVAVPREEFDKKVFIPSQRSSLNFSIGLNPETFKPDRGDGVHFQVTLTQNGQQTILLSKYINPSNNPCDRRWFDESVSLKEWSGKDVVLTFATDSGPSGDNSWDWAYWGNISVMDKGSMENGPTSAPNLPYKWVYKDRDVVIYENKEVLPRAFMVYNVINVANFNEALDAMDNLSLNLKQIAVVENLPNNLSTLINQTAEKTLQASGTTTRVNSGKIKIVIKTEQPGLLVISEQYYPGWHAYVNGINTPIYAVDGILQGVFLDKGQNEVTLLYRPLTFMYGLIISFAALLIVILGLYMDTRKTSRK